MPPWKDSIDAMLMIFPPLRRVSMCRPAARDSRKTFDRLTSITSSHSSSV
jgi:hypothetical protein